MPQELVCASGLFFFNCRMTAEGQENIVGKGENAAFRDFLLFHQCFEKVSYLKTWECGCNELRGSTLFEKRLNQQFFQNRKNQTFRLAKKLNRLTAITGKPLLTTTPKIRPTSY